MNPVLHQLRTDVRARRHWLGASVVFLFVAPLCAAWSMLAFPEASSNLFVAALCLAALVDSVLLATAPIEDFPFSGSCALWRTRPMPWGAMFAARSLWIGVLVLLPLSAGIGIALGWFRLEFWGAAAAFAFLAASAAVPVLLAATLRALADSRSAVAAMSGFLLVIAAFFLLWFAVALSWQVMGIAAPGAVFFAVVALVSGFAVAAWMAAARWRKRPAAFCLACGAAALAPLVIAAWGWSFGRPKIPALPEASLSVRLVEPAKARESLRPGETLLWRNVAVSGLKPKQILVPFRSSGKWRSALLGKSKSPGDWSDLERTTTISPMVAINHIAGKSVLPEKIRMDFPGPGQWMVAENLDFHPASLVADDSVDALDARQGIRSGRGEISFEFEGEVVEPRRVAVLPVADHARGRYRGGGVAVLHDPKWTGEWFSATVDVLRLGGGYQGKPGAWLECLEVVPTENLIFLIRHRPTGDMVFCRGDFRAGFHRTGVIGFVTNKISVMIPESYISRHGGDAETWMAETDLFVYDLFPVARYKSPELKADGYQLTPFKKPIPRRRPRRAEVSILADLPEHPSDEEIRNCLDSILRISSDAAFYQKQFDALPLEALVALARRMPLRGEANFQAAKALERRIGSVPADVLLAGLRRDPSFVRLCLKKGLRREAADILRPWVLERKPISIEDVLVVFGLLAERGPLDPELTAAMRWYFVRLGLWKYRDLSGTLQKWPEFDFAEAVAQAWNWRTGESHSPILAPYVLRLGDKEALRLTLKQLRMPQSATHPRDWLLQTLATRLDADLSLENAWRWAYEHFEELGWDAASKTFRVRSPEGQRGKVESNPVRSRCPAKREPDTRNEPTRNQ